MLRKLSAATVAGLTIAALAGCAGVTTEGSEGSDEPVTLNLAAWWPEETVADGIALANEALEDENITIEYEFVEFDQFNSYLNTQLESGGGPDLVVSGSFPSLIKTGAVLPIEDASVYENFNEAGLIQSTGQDGAVYGIPTWGWFSSFFYNTELFEQYGQEVPTTWDELMDVSTSFLDEGVTPISFGLAQGNDRALHSILGYLNNAYYENGDGSFEDDIEFALGEKKLADMWTEPLEDWSEIIDLGIITPEMLGIPEQQSMDAFKTGQAAMIITGPWHYEEFKESGVPFGTFSHVGTNPDNRWLIGGPGAPIGVNANSKNADAAFKALALLASQEVQQSFVDANPGSFASYQGVSPQLPEEYANVVPMLEAGNVAFPLGRFDVGMNSGPVGTELVAQLQKLILGEVTPEQVTANLDKVADSARY